MSALPDENGQVALEQAQEEERPSFLEGTNYQTPEDLRKAWEEQNRALTQANQRAAAAEAQQRDLFDRMAELEQRVQQAPQAGYDPQMDPWLLAEAQAFEEGEYQRAAQIRDARTAQLLQAAWQMWQQQTPQQPQVPDNLVDNLAAAHVEQEVARQLGPDYEQIRHDLEATLSSMPHAVRDYRTDPAGAVQDVLKVAQWLKAEKDLAERSAQLNTQQAQQAQAKRMVQTAPGAGGRAAGTPSARDDLVARFREIQAQQTVL